MSNPDLAEIAKETLEIIKFGCYGEWDNVVDIYNNMEASIAMTIDYPPDEEVLQPAVPGSETTVIDVMNMPTLDVAQAIVAGLGREVRVGVLNFASATKPGGGFLRGAMAQEEALAYASGLYATIKNSPMYAMHRERNNPYYTDYMIYSPLVPVFRDSRHNLLIEGGGVGGYYVDILTSPAVNVSALRDRGSSPGDDLIAEVMTRRIRRVLDIFALQGNKHLILGAWGCGVFGNDPVLMAHMFQEALETTHKNVFRHITFAVLDNAEVPVRFNAFAETFPKEVLAEIRALDGDDDSDEEDK